MPLYGQLSHAPIRQPRARLVAFAPDLVVDKDALDRAIRGAIRKVDPDLARSHEAEDVSSETCLALLRTIRSGRRPDDPARLLSYAYAIARNIAVNRLRRRSDAIDRQATGQQAELALAMAPADDGHCPISRLAERQIQNLRLKRVAHALRRLDPGERETLAQMLTRTGPMRRHTPQQSRTANRIAQRECRLRNKLRRLVRAADMQR